MKYLYSEIQLIYVNTDINEEFVLFVKSLTNCVKKAI